MMLAGSALLIPLFTATYRSIVGRSPGSWPLAIGWFGGGYAAVMAFFYSYAPTRIELRDDGVHAFYWWGERRADWARIQSSRRPYRPFRGFLINESTPEGAWRHYLLTLEQARTVMRDPRFLRRTEATSRLMRSLGLHELEGS
jgi:hypothetical protein